MAAWAEAIGASYFAVTELRFAHPRSRSPVRSRQGARLRRADAARVNGNVVSSSLNRAVANVRRGAVRTVRFGREKPRPGSGSWMC